MGTAEAAVVRGVELVDALDRDVGHLVLLVGMGDHPVDERRLPKSTGALRSAHGRPGTLAPRRRRPDRALQARGTHGPRRPGSPPGGRPRRARPRPAGLAPPPSGRGPRPPALPDGPIPLPAVIDDLVAGAAPGLVRTPGPRYFGFVVGGSVDAAVVADVLTTGWDQNAFNAALAPAALAFEDLAGAWLKELL